MGRKCSHCGNIGHNSRTCTNNKASTTFVGGSLRLFGVQLDVYSSSSSYSSIISMKKSFSMDCLHSSSSPSSSPSSSMSSRNLAGLDETSHDKTSLGYLSDGLIARPQERKKGVPWTEEEHRTFLIGLDKLGKGDWRGISRNYVTTRTPTQVASHAQKYFLRQASINKKKRRSSLFDMVGSSNNMVVKSSPLNSSNFKPSDDYPIPNCSQPLIQTSVSDNPKPDECSQIASSSSASHHHHHHHHHQHQHHHDYMPVWIHGLTNPQMNSNPNAANKQITTSSNAATTAPDLELKLAGPRSPNLEQNNKSSSGHLLAGPITVT